MAPPEVKGRQFDYPFGANLNYIPRADISISFAELRALADALPLLRAVIETRKDQDRRPELCGEGAGAHRCAGRLESHRRGFRVSRVP